MIESALPQEILQLWERAKGTTDVTTELTGLLDFLKREVETQQRVSMAKSIEEKGGRVKEHLMMEPTARCLLTKSKPVSISKPSCIWCEKGNHETLECYKLQRMSIDDRREYLKKQKMCTICLKKGHHAKVCKTFIKCIVCGRRHAVVLCNGKKEEPNDSTVMSTAANLSAVPRHGQGTTLLQTVTVIVSNGKQHEMVRVLFDNGAQRSYIREDIVKRLNIPSIGNEVLNQTLFGDVQISSKNFNVYDINISSVDKSFNFKLSALGQSCICRNIPKYNKYDIQDLLTRHNITLTDTNQTSDDIGLLIGADFSGLILTGHLVRLYDSLVAIHTKLGWTLQGKAHMSSTINMMSTQVAMFCSSDAVSNFWCLETLGIRDPIETKTKQKAKLEVLANFEENVSVNDEGRYEVFLPWKVGHNELLNNYDLAYRRLQSVTKKLQSSDIYESYDKVFDEWLNLGIIEKVTNPDEHKGSSHYLPHRPIIKEESLTTKIRPVFDASAKDKYGKSLNICLDTGINMLDKIPKLLNGFRKGGIGITADIAKAFLQISITPLDRDMLRFLWWDKDNKLITFRHRRVVFGLTCSPFLLSATIQHHLNNVSNYNRDTADILSECFYVDNVVTSLDSEEDVWRFEKEAKVIMNQAKFDLRQWVISPTSHKNTDKVISVLGLHWHTSSDTFSCNMSSFCDLNKIVVTKRSLLSIAQKIYDPIGFTSAVTLIPRLILQETWCRNLEWDSPLPSDLNEKFELWCTSLCQLKHCKIPRRLTEGPFSECILQLHMFCDASSNAYAACIFLRSDYKGKITIRLISAKSRIAPPKKPSIPRLELLAALIGSRLLAESRRDLKLECEEYCWTDSNVALCWIKKELQWNTFVGNRVREIRKNTDVNNWFHIPGNSNWADLPSRGCDAAILLTSGWLEGPQWLKSENNKWINLPVSVDNEEVSTAPLPVERTRCSAPFEITGVDLAGPLILRDGQKCWIVLYTCAVYRAVHLEATRSLSTEAFMMTFRRFIARRGRVSIMMSDNGTNFVGTKNLLSEIDWTKVEQDFVIQGIKWKLNAPTAAWWGGFWERLIRILKDLLKRVLGKSSVTYEELQTILCDCEATLNGRPLTYIEDEKSNSLEPLKPIHILQPILQSDVTDLDELDRNSLNKRLREIKRRFPTKV
ncbi:uncharacterized protein LOC131843017 [Achroia grisella]|uniref:uncharacterized protein LOC131843017 n=1 Tax=Achroia grisella TaxID=688607 RepID=UPI0027D2AEB1|nr:uncharacterized protein LOC131843017 [Achroia grisella]